MAISESYLTCSLTSFFGIPCVGGMLNLSKFFSILTTEYGIGEHAKAARVFEKYATSTNSHPDTFIRPEYDFICSL